VLTILRGKPSPFEQWPELLLERSVRSSANPEYLNAAFDLPTALSEGLVRSGRRLIGKRHSAPTGTDGLVRTGWRMRWSRLRASSRQPRLILAAIIRRWSPLAFGTTAGAASSTYANASAGELSKIVDSREDRAGRGPTAASPMTGRAAPKTSRRFLKRCWIFDGTTSTMTVGFIGWR